MILSDDEAKKRIDSPMNLINQLRLHTNSNGSRSSAMGLFGIGKKTEPLRIKEAIITPVEQALTALKPNEAIEQPTKQSFNPFVKSQALIPSLPLISQAPAKQQEEPSLDTLLSDSESQIKLAHAHDQALSLLNRSVEMLATKLDDIKADRLPAVISAASKTVESIRKERLESAKQGKDKEVHYHFYTPLQKSVSDYQVIEID